MSAIAGWMAVGAGVGAGVSVGGIAVAVSGTGASVGGMDVAVDGTGKSVGATAIAVAVGRTGVAVSVGAPQPAIRSRAKRMKMSGLADLDMGLLLSCAWPMDNWSQAYKR